ncbi:glycosyltransferase [Prosthecobacter sp.]|uniref:glycosyltransferase family 2 protein n=1 Tax=Prosthecobacter sp. TaxID=1965333 RepID=UPI00248A614B|nr:glycosyltransferase [Prosthecobacter sp.]MDI1315126.1 glycosyltransferase [Prosthecobacter sp.]
MSLPEIPISVAVPACRRFEQLRTTLTRLRDCVPPPAEILVHLDGNDAGLRALVEGEFPNVRLLHSSGLIGPGGARNQMMREARCAWVAHFDDDSFPVDADFFARAWRLISRYPETAVLAATILPMESHDPQGLWLQAIYVGCGHLMNRDWFLRTRGYLPLPVAYNLEEVDVSIQLHDLGGRCLQSGDLRVFHDHPVPVRETEDTQVAMMINTVLFPLLRYPLPLLPQACGSILRRLFRLALKREWRVIQRSLLALPAAMGHYLPVRRPVRTLTAWSWLLLRRVPLRVASTLAFLLSCVHD